MMVPSFGHLGVLAFGGLVEQRPAAAACRAGEVRLIGKERSELLGVH
ncbi:hypothetical protein [Gordonia iterans]